MKKEQPTARISVRWWKTPCDQHWHWGCVCRGGGFIYGHNILSEIIVIGKIQDLSDSH